MGDTYIKHDRVIRKESKNVWAECGEDVRRLNLGDTTRALSEGGKKTDHAIMSDTAEILQKWTGEEVGRVRGK